MTRLYVPVRLRWSDLDAYAHVNNVEMFRLLEEARITAFWRHPLALDADVWPTAVIDSVLLRRRTRSWLVRRSSTCGR